MLKALPVIFILNFILALAVAQNNSPNIYLGNKDDGSGVAISQKQNLLPAIYAGGTNDGYMLAVAYKQNSLPNIFGGANSDGFSSINIPSQNTSPNIYSGGVNDGVHSISIYNANALPNIFRGGTGDGYSIVLSGIKNLSPGIYTGGQGDGWARDIKATTTYVFTGTGNWDVPANWEGNLVPPTILPIGAEIIVNPGSGICVLNVPQYLSSGSKLTVMPGKILQVSAIQ